jgi:hypothetical protein
MRELKGGNLDLDLIPSAAVAWEQDVCPWNEAEGVATHRCAVKNISMCLHFHGIKDPDTVLCSYGEHAGGPM